MELPRLTTVHGAYVYLMATLLLVAAVFGVYLLAVAAGLAPDPSTLGTVGGAGRFAW